MAEETRHAGSGIRSSSGARDTALLGQARPTLAVSCLARVYLFYVAGHVPERKDPRAVDRKLIKRYGIDASRAERA